jgi:hypothetical protein
MIMDNYRVEVLQFYEEKKASCGLSNNLMLPSSARLRMEVRLLFNAGCNNEEKQMLKEFLNIPFDKEITDSVIKRIDPDKFKPLTYLLKKKVKASEKSVELLAWLIDFPKRPYSNYFRLSSGKKDLLSGWSITERGIIDEKIDIRTSHQRPIDNDITLDERYGTFQSRYAGSTKSYVGIDDLVQTEAVTNEKVTLQYPSGVKIDVDADNISLIAKLVKL